MADRKLRVLTNRRKRRRDSLFRFFYSIAASVANKSSEFMVWQLNKSIALFSIEKVNLDTYVTDQSYANIAKFNHNSYSDHLSYLGCLVNELPKCNESQYRILCHGVRNGNELHVLRDLLLKTYSDLVIFGTDISPTILNVSNGIKMDFHDSLPENYGKFDLIFSNSLDQAHNPRAALNNWIDSLNNKSTSRLALLMTASHGKLGSSQLDPFSCEPEVFPFLLLKWFGPRAYIDQVIFPFGEASRSVIFLIKRA